jgi:hypothetical protein
MFGRILLDNDYFLVTAGLLGAIKVTLKSRGLTLKATREERTKLLDVLDELKRRGYSVEPDSKEFEEILDGFSEALLGRGGYRWQAYFLVTTCVNIVSDVVGEIEDTDNSENHKDSQDDWMDKVRKALDVTPEEWRKVIEEHTFEEMEKEEKARNLKPEVDNYELANIAYENWKEEAKDQLEYIEKYVDEGMVKFEDVEEVGYEIKSFLNTAEEWDEGILIYDFTTEAKQMLESLHTLNIGPGKN